MIRLARFRQSLFGSYRKTTEPGIERPLELELSGTRDTLVPGLGGTVAVRGEISARGFAEHRAVSGSVRLERWVPFAMSYDLEFTGDDDRAYRLVAERRPRLADIVYSASRIRGRITGSDGEQVATADLRLDFRRDLGGLVEG